MKESKMMEPILSVVMLVYNGERYLREAISSVLNQTFKDFELIVINDGSTDESENIINSFTDVRIRTLTNLVNKGIPFSRNLGLAEARGKYLAWTDCDDLNLPTRFAKQVDFLNTNEDFGGCGTWLCRFKGARTYYVSKAFEDHNKIKAALLFKPAAVPNATVMLRLSEVRKNDITYNSKYSISEDYDFILRCAQHFKFYNIQEVLYKYRDSETSIMKKFEEQESKGYDIMKRVYKAGLKSLNLEPQESDLSIHYSICSRKIFETFSDYQKGYHWLINIKFANTKTGVYDQRALDEVLADQFFFSSKKASKFGMKTLRFYMLNSLKNNWVPRPVRIAKLGVRCVLKHDKFEFRKR